MTNAAATIDSIKKGQLNVRKFALVIGIRDYGTNVDQSALINSVNDARDVCGKLVGLGWQCTPLTDSTPNDINSALKAFSDRLNYYSYPQPQVLFFWAGNVHYADRDLYLNTKEAESDRTTKNLSIKHVIMEIEKSNHEQCLYILACSRSCCPDDYAVNLGDNGIGLYAAKPGQEAKDFISHSERNSLFVKYLLKNLKPGVLVGELVERIKNDMKNSKENKSNQEPVLDGITSKEFYF